MRKQIEFQQRDPKESIITSPAVESKWQDETYRPEYRGIQMKFNVGMNWVRVLPPIKPSTSGWIHQFRRYSDKDGRFPAFVDPTCFGEPSIFEQARHWLRKAHPELCYNKNNPGGFRLYPQDRGILWVLDTVAEPGRMVRLLNVSMYDGSRGGAQGLGSQIATLAASVDTEPGSPTLNQSIYGDISDPEAGRLVGIDRSATKAAEYTTYSIKIGSAVNKLDLDKATDEETCLLCPLEKVLKSPTSEEQHNFLQSYFGEKLYKEFVG
jgi:hypothetical protein